MKLHAAPLRAGLLPRGELLATGHSHVVVTAPPGYGKTTALAQYAAAATHPIAWVSLDEADDDIRSRSPQALCRGQHRERLADTGRPDKEQGFRLPLSRDVSMHSRERLDDVCRLPEVRKLLDQLIQLLGEVTNETSARSYAPSSRPSV